MSVNIEEKWIELINYLHSLHLINTCPSTATSYRRPHNYLTWTSSGYVVAPSPAAIPTYLTYPP